MIEISIYFKSNYKDVIVDTLLSEGFDNFYFFECKKYSSRLLKSTKEMVTGRVDFAKFELFVKNENKDRIINKLYSMISKNELSIYVRDLHEV
ncbi:DUF3240 family protein [Helicobacter sp. MIT 14-3879]|uniref:DUF3240 family protein n=1 Tax=Helicobacter sp. MIT 14-3879 TaxID=2040649 RepID=UPI000E1F5DCA|nr:DUF3240 family protein [Helicobacter sp. MIT 14-3879]RDU65555.1 DUF3240 domain-containing protein [Helicobacter sp. MIT 14-3879]